MRKLFILFALVLVFVSWIGWTYRVRLVSETLTRNFGVPTHVADVELSTHGVVLRGLAMQGPGQSSALAIETVRVTLKPWNMLADPVHLSEVTLDNVYVILDVSKNWTALFNRLTKQEAAVSSVPETNHEARADKRYIVDHVIVTNIHVSLDNRPISALNGEKPTVARLELRDVGAQSPRSLQQTVQLVLGAILEQASGSHPQLGTFADGLMRNADEELKSVLKNIKQQYQEASEDGTWKRVRSFFDWKK